MGVSLLAALGLHEGWVARSIDEYVALAVAAAADVPKLARLRAELRPRMLASPLCDAPAFVRGLEDVYRCAPVQAPAPQTPGSARCPHALPACPARLVQSFALIGC